MASSRCHHAALAMIAGYFSETFRQDVFSEKIGDFHFVQDNQSLSAERGTVRGLHFQLAPRVQGKLVRCVAGAIFDVAVDLRISSPYFRSTCFGRTLSR